MRFMRHIASWALALFLIFMFLQATLYPFANLTLGPVGFGPVPDGMVKFYDAPGENIVFATIAEKTGYAIAEPTGRVIVGVLELLAVILLLVPAWRRFGAFISFLIMAGAAAAHLTPSILGREIPLALNNGAGATDGGALFALAVAMLAASLLLLVVHPRKQS